jgi:hypothetical protein
MSLGMPYNTTVSNRRWTSWHRPSQRRLQSKSSQEGHRDAIRHDTHKPTASVETPTNDTKKSVHELSDGKRQDAGKSIRASRRLSSRQRLKIPLFMFMSLGKSPDTTLAKRRRTLRRRLRIPSAEKTSLGSYKIRHWQIDAERRNASCHDTV